jgi:hypothetical protein
LYALDHCPSQRFPKRVQAIAEFPAPIFGLGAFCEVASRRTRAEPVFAIASMTPSTTSVQSPNAQPVG